MKTFKSTVAKHFPGGAKLGEVLLKVTALSKNQIEEAAQKGAVWIEKAKGKKLRERSLDRGLSPQDSVLLFYDPKVLSLPAADSECLFENQHYGIWIKKAGVVPQGSEAGDHASLLRHIEIKKNQDIYLIHRLDRETAGPMVFGYTSEAAAKLSNLFQKNQVKKEYEAVVLGALPIGAKATIDVGLDDKRAISHYEVLDSRNERSLLKVEIETGRLHQIRRHLDHIGHPVMGDPKYGKGNKNREGLKLIAKSISFQDPWIKKSMTWVYSQSLSL